MLKICISFDYDTPIGYNESYYIKHLPFDAEIVGTSKLLKILRDYNIKASFGIVAKILNKNDRYKKFADQRRGSSNLYFLQQQLKIDL